MVSLSNNTQGNVNITTRNGAGVNLTSNNDTDVNANMNGNAQRAKSWAVGEGLIDGVDYSAKHYAQDAKESAEQASGGVEAITEAKEQALSAIDTEKTEAIADMETAKSEKINEIENTAAGFEDDLEALTTRAETAATNAETSETNAATSATSASQSATSASNSATSAATNANLAENYKNDAYTYANNAASSRNAAKSYADNANEDMITALNAAAEARTSANSASQSATTATNAKNAAEIARDAAGNYAQQAEQAKDDIEAELDNYVQTSRQINGKDLTTDITLTSSDIGALSDTTKYGYSIALSLNTTDYKLTLTLKDQDGTTLSTKTVDFPIESVVVNGSYDSTNQKIVLTLQNGNTIDIPVGDLISGLQSEITSTNMLDSDLVDDTNSTHKFVSANEKTTWNNKQNAISDLSTIRTNATNGANAYTIISGYGDIVTHNASEFITPSRLTTVLADYVLSSDLSTTLADYVTNTNLTTTLADYATQQWVQTNANALYSAMQNWVNNQGFALSSSLATVATSGSYNDLSNQPTIGNGTITFTQGGVTKGTITTNQTGNSTIALDAGGGGGTVDQTFNGSSTNAQSGVAIAGAGFLQNTATGTNSLTLLGTATSSNLAINIGYNSSARGGNIAIGTLANTSGTGAVAIGPETEASAINTLAIGNTAKATANNAIQIGYGTNNTANKFNVRSFELLDIATGYIPDARISSNIARTSAIPDVSNFVTNTSLATTLSSYATQQWVIEQASALATDLQTWVTNQGYTSNVGTVTSVNNTQPDANGNVAITIPTVPTNVSAFTNDAGYLTSIPSGYVQNTATATDSLTILGSTNNRNYSVLIGVGTTAGSEYNTVIGNTATGNGTYATAYGYYARASGQYTTAIGHNSYAHYNDTTAIGRSAETSAAGTLAVGSIAKATAQRATSIGYSSQATQYQATALGYEAKATANSALQIGTGTNSTANTLQVGTYTLLNTSTGLIPDARISSNIARTSDIPASEIFVAEYGTTSYADVQTAINSGKVVFCDYNGVQCSYVQTITGTPNVAQFRYITAYTTYTINVYSNDSWEVNSTTLARTSDLSGYVVADNNPTYIYNAGSDVSCGYDDGTDYKAELYIDGSFISLYSENYNTGYNSFIDVSSEVISLNYSSSANGGIEILNADGNLALLTVTNNSNLAVNGSEVVTGDNTRFDGQWVIISGTEVILDGASLTNSSNTPAPKTVTLPDDDCIYEVMFRGRVTTGTSSGNSINLQFTTNVFGNTVFVCSARTRSNSSVTTQGTVIVPVKAGTNNLSITRNSGYNGTADMAAIAYRRVGTNT